MSTISHEDALPPCKPGTRCDSCQQTPHDYDRDLLPEVTAFVQWARKGKDHRGFRVVAEGHECGACFKVRCNSWGRIDQARLIKMRQENPEPCTNRLNNFRYDIIGQASLRWLG